MPGSFSLEALSTWTETQCVDDPTVSHRSSSPNRDSAPLNRPTKSNVGRRVNVDDHGHQDAYNKDKTGFDGHALLL
jgi:hypothetical protein